MVPQVAADGSSLFSWLLEYPSQIIELTMRIMFTKQIDEQMSKDDHESGMQQLKVYSSRICFLLK